MLNDLRCAFRLLVKSPGFTVMMWRDFAEKDDVPGGPKIALISEGLGRRRFDGSNLVTGQRLMVDAVPREIIGVLPNEMRIIRSAQVFIPLGDLRADKDVLQRDNHRGFWVLGRLKPGVTLAQARPDLDNIAYELTGRYPQSLLRSKLKQDEIAIIVLPPRPAAAASSSMRIL